jgi:translocation and assembly module TamB
VASNNKIKRIFIKSMKVLGWITFSILALFILLLVLIRLPSVQHKITQRAVTFLKDKIGTEVRLERAFISFPKQIVLEGLYVEDQSEDTLVYVGELVSRCGPMGFNSTYT